MTLSREEFETLVRELRDAVERHTAELKIQFERIAQMQAELDSLRMTIERRASRKKSMSEPLTTAADRRH
jgi:hypothetical protein